MICLYFSNGAPAYGSEAIRHAGARFCLVARIDKTGRLGNMAVQPWQAPNGVAAIPATVLAPCPALAGRLLPRSRRLSRLARERIPVSLSPLEWRSRLESIPFEKPRRPLQPDVWSDCVLPPFRDVISAIF